MQHALVISALLILSGCASGYSQFYQAYPDANEVVARRISAPPAAPSSERAGGEVKEIFATYLRRGYNAIGYSHFNSGMAESDAGALAQGVKVGADLVVIVDPRYTNTRTGAVPITTPTSTTSYTTGTATAYGPRGTTTAYGSATTTTYGSQTNYIPYSVDRFDYGAIYFVKTRFQFGAFFRDLSNEERQQLQSNKGVALTLIVDGSPAFEADFLEGDIIVAIDGQSVSGGAGFRESLASNHGRTVQMKVVRADKVFTKPVALRD
jgi:hypothetical protein